MNIKEDIAVFFCLEHTAAVHTAADNLKRLNQIILKGVKLKLAELFNVNILQHLGCVTLNNVALLVEVEGCKQRRMVADSCTHSVSHLLHIERILVHTHHSKEVVHC